MNGYSATTEVGALDGNEITEDPGRNLPGLVGYCGTITILLEVSAYNSALGHHHNC